ncbi:hypothetical protein XENTR_v10012396 [Xenopus tropicalis]|nr:hypothetical protein XENTR_v10012396 [Xenopus tropicalis]
MYSFIAAFFLERMICLEEKKMAGTNCQNILTPCSPEPCHNGGICQESEDFKSFSCLCATGWHGQRCTIDIDECITNPCKNYGRCQNTKGGYICHCFEGFNGVNCENNIDDCLSNPCQNGASCVDGINTFSCNCLAGFHGDKCQKDVDECASNPCKNGGSCTDYVNSYTCKCQPGFDGIHCDNNIDECTDTSCFNGATCVDGINSFTCQCPQGFTGQFCLFEINECGSHPCINGGTCVDGMGTYHCTCPVGYRGKNCEELVDLCSGFPCKNRGICKQVKTEPKCICPTGWTGIYCDIPDVSCEVAASQRGVAVQDLCQHAGICINTGFSHRCQCRQGYIGSYCEGELDECASNPCQNSATCVDRHGGYECKCLPGYQGVNCEYEIDECQIQPCHNGGTCVDLVNQFRCSCPPGTRGPLCEENIDDCAPSSEGPHCFNGGRCLDKIGGYSCECLPGFAGERCEGDVNECLSNPCSAKGSLDCIQLDNNYLCKCKPGFTGRHCETIQDLCPTRPCLNGGTCAVAVNMPEGFTCQCPPGFSGSKCQYSNNTCGHYKCKVGENCIKTPLGPRCYCPTGPAGNACQSKLGCASQPCKNNGVCQRKDQPPYYTCNCPNGIVGLQCEILLIDGCHLHHCPDKARDGYCDQECNTHECLWDGGDCSLTMEDPWANCSSSLKCWEYFNGQCDELCNTPECLFDNFECQEKESICKYDKYCEDHYANGHCDKSCNTKECGWDGLDCSTDKPENLAEGTLVIVVLMPPKELLKNSRNFLRELGSILRTNLRIKRNPDGSPMVFPYFREKSSAQRSRRSLLELRVVRELEEQPIGSKVSLEIDNQQCVLDSDQCFKTTDSAAAMLAAHAVQGTLNYPLVSVGVEKAPPSSQTLMYILPVILAIIIVILLLVVVLAKKKRKHGTLWFPEGFLLHRDTSNQKRREPVGQDAVGMKNLSVPIVDGNLLDSNQNDHWSDDRGPQPKKSKSEGQALLSGGDDQVDSRQWTQQHLVAADIRMTPSLALTPPQAEQDMDVIDVNVRGPDGCTPLMLASLRMGSPHIEEDDEEAEDPSANVITDLIYQGACLQAQTDRTGETALHLAARYSRADAAKRLLDAGADANSQDSMGRTPLHAAVSADAQGVFQILIRNRVTDLDARMNDGTTPLILAARLAVEGMVADLINCQADVNAVDDHGKSALHWAAAVNNVEATIVLLKNGANRDMQDNKEETPLFLAAREGSFEAAKMLLDYFANREITDHMDRLPRDIAKDRMHHDIVRLLDEYNLVHSPQGQPGTMLSNSLSPAVCGSNRSFLNLKHAAQTKKARRPSAKSVAPRSLPNLAKEPKDTKNRRRKKSDTDSKAQLSESSVTLSPVDSLESPHATSSPTITSPGALHTSPGQMIAASTLQPPRTTMSLTNLQPVGCAANNMLPSVGQLLSHSAQNNVLTAQRQLTMSSDWLSRMERNDTQYNEMFGIVHHDTNNHSCIPQQNGIIQADIKPTLHMGVARDALPPIMTFQLIPKSGMNQQSGIQTLVQQASHGQNVAAMYQIPDRARITGSSVPIAMMHQHDGQLSQTMLTAYHPLQNPMGKYPTPPSQHSYTSTDKTPNHNGHLPGEHPYLTPSPESPDQWSSSSPNSASDWSDVTTSPTPNGNQRMPATHMPEQSHNGMQIYA